MFPIDPTMRVFRSFLHIGIDFPFAVGLLTMIRHRCCIYSFIHWAICIRLLTDNGKQWIHLHLCSLGKPIHTVQLLLAERMHKLRDVAQSFEFYGPPHPEDPQGTLRPSSVISLRNLSEQVLRFGRDRILIVVVRTNGSSVPCLPLWISILDIPKIDTCKPCGISLLPWQKWISSCWTSINAQKRGLTMHNWNNRISSLAQISVSPPLAVNRWSALAFDAVVTNACVNPVFVIHRIKTAPSKATSSRKRPEKSMPIISIVSKWNVSFPRTNDSVVTSVQSTILF